jgi:Xaa-Pro aminopeptidase
VYLPGRGGVRIEDVIVVNGDGSSGAAGLLNTTTRELLAL